jgi:hypothetical protein
VADWHDYEAERIGLPKVNSISMAGYIMGVNKTSPRVMLALGQPDGWRQIWGGTERYPSINGFIYDERGSGTVRVFDRNLHPRVQLPARLKLLHACGQ